MTPRCAVEPRVKPPILFKAALTVVICVPLVIDRFVPAPVTVLDVLDPTVTEPLSVISARVPKPDSVTLPLSAIKPEPVVILPAFQTNGPEIVNDAFVPLANDRS